MSERTGPSVNRTRILGCVILGTVLAVGVVQAATPPLPLRDGVPTLAPLLEKVTPAVVNISVATRARPGGTIRCCVIRSFAISSICRRMRRPLRSRARVPA